MIKTSVLPADAVHAHIDYLESLSVEELRTMLDQTPTGPYAAMLRYVLLEKVLKKKD